MFKEILVGVVVIFIAFIFFIVKFFHISKYYLIVFLNNLADTSYIIAYIFLGLLSLIGFFFLMYSIFY